MSSWGQSFVDSGHGGCRRHWRHGAAGRWTLREEDPKYAPDRTCDVEHLRLEASVDLPSQKLQATATLTLRAAYGPFREITLDAVDLTLEGVEDGAGRQVPYRYLGGKLTVTFPKPIKGTALLKVRYQVERPSHGLYFVGPNRWEKDATWQLWSQGEEEEARHWIPCHDTPHERMTTEFVITAESRYTVIANGALVAVAPEGRRKTWTFRESTPYPSYLISLVVGVFKKEEDRWRGIPVEYYAEPHLAGWSRRSFGKTPAMLEHFSERIGVPYPYEKYAQAAVRHFVAGGMENLSATTQTDNTLHDERAALDWTSDDLVAHELAHQWFGDLLTCEHWAHAWLNEGFATYFEAVWLEHDKGRAEADYDMILKAREYMDEAYRRPIVSRRFAHPFQLFDMHLYPKAAWVLHMLRKRLGDEWFWKAVRLYVERHRGGSVETIDLVRSAEQVSGKSLQCFFDQWLHAPGHPELEGEVTWDGEAGAVKVLLRQTQKRDAGAPVYRLPIRVDARLAKGAVVTRTFEMDQPSQTFYLHLAEKPIWVALDGEGSLLRTMNVKQPIEWLEAALDPATRDDRVFARVDAARQLGEQAGQRATEILARVARRDPMWGVQAEAAQALGKLRSPAALDALIGLLRVRQPKVRRAVALALGGFQSPRAVEALLAHAKQGDKSYFVQHQTLVSLGRAGGASAAPFLRKELKAAVKRRDWHDLIAQGAALGLAAARDEAAVDDLLELARNGAIYWGTRAWAIRALAELGAARPLLGPRLVEELTPFLEDDDYLVATRTPPQLVTLGQGSAIPELRRKAETSPRAHMREACLAAAEDLAGQATKTEATDKLRAELDRLREETRELRERVDRPVSPTGRRGGSRRRSPA